MNGRLVMCLATTIVVLLAGCSQNSSAKRRVYGTVEVDEIDVASRIPARVRRVAVQQGQKVKAGDLLVEFEDDVIAAKRKQAEALLAAAKSKDAIAKDAVRPEEKAQLAAAVSAAKKQMEFAVSSLGRAKEAFAEGAISRQALDEVEFKAAAATENYNATAAKQRMAKVGARPEERAGAAALLEQARNGVAEAEAYGKDMALVAPIDGEVFQILNHEGELVPAGYPVVTLLKTSDLWVTINVPETDLAKYPLEGPTTVTVPALGDKKLSAPVRYVAPMAGFATRSTTQDRGAFDLKTFEVRLSLPAGAAGLRPGMTALVEPGTAR